MVLKAYSRNGFEQIPFISEPRAATSSKLVSSLAARPNAIAICPRDGKSLDQIAGRRFPEPVADLVMVGLDLPRLHDVRVVGQPIEELRAVGLGIDRLQLDAFDEHLLLRALGLWVDVEAASALQIPAKPVSGPRLFS